MDCFSEYIPINGARQSLMTMRTDKRNPVLLIVHGGSGTPDRPLVRHCSAELAERFTVVCWDQRGSGFSYTREELSADLLLSDLKALVEYLLKTYQKDKLYIAGHSWGAWLGLRFVALYPEYVKYYIGTGQFVSQQKDEIIRYQFVRANAERKGAARQLQKLDAFGAPEDGTYPHRDAAAKNFVIRHVFLNHGYFSQSSGSTMAQTAALYLKLYFGCYKFAMPKFLLGVMKSLDELNHKIYLQDSITPITELSVPVLMISGESDMVCPVSVVKEWFDNLTAPKKDYVKIKNAAHMVNFEQPQEWNRLVLSVLEKAE